MRTVIEMAREAGIRDCTCNGTLGCLERFVELVRADERKKWEEQIVVEIHEAVLEEREKIIATASDLYYWDDSEKLIEAIRARGNT